MNQAVIDALGRKLAITAMQVVARHPDIHRVNRDTLEAIVQAMRDSAPKVIDQLLYDLQATPWVSLAVFGAAALDLAQAGLAVLRKN